MVAPAEASEKQSEETMHDAIRNPIERITDAVCDVLAEQGVTALSMRNVAARADATIGLITHHFPNRAAMVKAAARASWRRDAAGVVWPETADRDAVLSAVKSFLPLDAVRRRRLAVWIGYWALAQHDPDLHEIHDEVHTALRGHHQRWILTLGFASEEAQRMADRLCVSLDGLMLYALLYPDHWTPERQLEAAGGMIDDIFAACARRQAEMDSLK
ncbi:TetR/AcrR family transcriptional regulator [Paenirhodobacter populi]|uniref:TetR family transcriptional regulator n=1 Tax=Paenirhodobacter populi TaxID=2306993 RepID=A0A443IKA3_9RHOB|nr:TetR/AcrR family transcriptional regulator [Sinirhodobacter populi]RWR05203.1 TetR family transcriptional regulator [Sinirhodobacter populi]